MKQRKKMKQPEYQPFDTAPQATVEEWADARGFFGFWRVVSEEAVKLGAGEDAVEAVYAQSMAGDSRAGGVVGMTTSYGQTITRPLSEAYAGYAEARQKMDAVVASEAFQATKSARSRQAYFGTSEPAPEIVEAAAFRPMAEALANIRQAEEAIIAAVEDVSRKVSRWATLLRDWYVAEHGGEALHCFRPSCDQTALPNDCYCAKHSTAVNGGDSQQSGSEKQSSEASKGTSNGKSLVRLPAALSSTTYPIQTSQEWDVWSRGIAAGRSGKGWLNSVEQEARLYSPKEIGLTHYLAIPMHPGAAVEGTGFAELETMTEWLDADALLAYHYIAHLLKPNAPLPPGTTAVGWIDLDDVACHIDPNHSTKSPEQRALTRRSIYIWILFGERARAVGKRSIEYRDKITEAIIPTYIDSPMWSIQGRKTPLQPSLLAEYEVPRAVEIVLSREWMRLLMETDLQQFLPHGEVLGRIPPGKAAGAWGRSIGLVLANEWRKKPREASEKSLRLTRRYLLTCYEPRIAPVEDLLNGSDPGRAVSYWGKALGALAEVGFIAKESEAAPNVAGKRLDSEGKPLPSQGWAKAWLDAKVLLVPGPAVMGSLVDMATRKFERQPRPYPELSAPRKRGRPRKAQSAGA